MKNSKLVIVVVAIILLAVFVFSRTRDAANDVKINTETVEPSVEDVKDTETGYETFKSPELGIEFKYKTGAEGYVLTERNSVPEESNSRLVKTLVLAEAKFDPKEVPVGGELPPMITIQVFENEKHLDPLLGPQTWAEENIKYTNFAVKVMNLVEFSLDGANAVRFTGDGLYRSDNVIALKNGYAYVMIGMYLDEGSPIHQDFNAIIESVRFI